VFQRVVIELGLGEGFAARQERHLGSGRVACVAGNGQRAIGDAVREAHLVNFACAANLQLQGNGKRVDHGHADAVQTARNLVGVLVEFSAGVQLGHDDLGRRHAFFLVDVGRDAATVIRDRYRSIRIKRHRYDIRMTGKRFVDRVVDDLIHHVVQTGAVIRVADIHARPLAHGIQALQHLDGIGTIFGAGAGFGLRIVGHSATGLSRLFGQGDSLRITSRTPRGL